MAHNEHVKMLRRSVFAWNDWRKQQLEVYLDLSEADLFRADLSGARLSGGCMNDSAGKFCPDKWTREGEEGKVEEKGHEEIPHEDEKEDQDVAARPTARSHSRSDQPNSSGEFSEKHPGHASARCARPDLSGRRLCSSVSQTGTSRRSAVETGVGHRLASAGKPPRPPGRRDGAGTVGLEICALVAISCSRPRRDPPPRTAPGLPGEPA